MAVSSSPEEWATSGKSLFQNKRYLQAKHCFERASLHREVAVADAYHLREQARAIPAGSRHTNFARFEAFLAAASAFVDCANVATKEKRAYFRNAADCFIQGGNDRKAAHAYMDAEEYNLAAKLYRKCGMFDEAVQVAKDYEKMMDANVVESIIDVARLFYFKEHNLECVPAVFLL